MDERGRIARLGLEPEEVSVDRILATIPREAPPLGFRDAVLSRIADDRTPPWEWTLAAALALPSLSYVAFQLATHGGDFIASLADLALVTEATDLEAAALTVDGLVVLAMALLGLASIVVAHALTATHGRAVAAR